MAKGVPLGSYGGKLGWSAGLGSWLDDPASKVNRYWRELEFGTQGDWSGRTVAGLWADTIGNGPLDGVPFAGGTNDQKLRPSFRKGTPPTPEGMLSAARNAIWVFLGGGRGPNMERLNPQYVYHYRYMSFGRRRLVIPGSGERRPVRTAAEARRARESIFHFFMTHASSADQIPFVSGTIVREIAPRHYYAKAIADFRPRLIEQELQGMRDAARWAIGDARGGEEFRKFRASAADENSTAPRKGRARPDHAQLSSKYIPSGGAEVSIAASAQIQFAMRNANGQFINGAFQSTLREVNARVAAAYLREVAALMEFHRPGTDALIRATLDRRNRYPDDGLE